MANRVEERKKLRCSFCNKSQEQVRKLIAGPNVYICDECIDICSEIIQDEFDNEMIDTDINLLTPKEIKDFLDDYVISNPLLSSLFHDVTAFYFRTFDFLSGSNLLAG